MISFSGINNNSNNIYYDNVVSTSNSVSELKSATDFVDSAGKELPDGPPRIEAQGEESFWAQEKEIFKLTLYDALLSLIMFQVALPFFDSENCKANSEIALGLIVVLGFSIRQITLLFQKSVKFTIAEDNCVSKKLLQVNNAISNYVPHILLSLSSLFHTTTVMHELGHYAATRYVFNFAPEKIPSIHLCVPWYAHMKRPDLTPFEHFKNIISYSEDLYLKNRLLISSAGPIAELAFSTALISVAHFQKPNSYVKRVLNFSAGHSIFNLFSYAYSAYQVEQGAFSGHDFANMRDKGIDPLVCMIGIIGLPLLVKSGLILYDSRNKVEEVES